MAATAAAILRRAIYRAILAGGLLALYGFSAAPASCIGGVLFGG